MNKCKSDNKSNIGLDSLQIGTGGDRHAFVPEA